MRFPIWLDDVEFWILAIVAGLLLAVGPLVIAYRLVLVGSLGSALLTGAVWLTSVVACVRDFRRHRFSWISLGVLSLWLVTTLFVGSTFL